MITGFIFFYMLMVLISYWLISGNIHVSGLFILLIMSILWPITWAMFVIVAILAMIAGICEIILLSFKWLMSKILKSNG